MDFGTLLDFAKQNEKPAKEVKCYRTTFAPPKKEQKTKSLSVNIQKFLARKEEEEKLKVVKANKKRDGLLALRAQDSKANKRVRAMLKSTKAANKAAIDDARDDVNTAVTMAGPSQPDEDDYGYVSQEASAFYNKLMDKYSSAPAEDPKFSKKSQTVKDLSSTKDRVRMALLKEEEEESAGHKRRKRRTKEEMRGKNDDDDGDNICYDAPDRVVTEKEPGSNNSYSVYERSEPEEVKKKRPPAPPPMDFAELLKVAAQKQFEPIKIEKKEQKNEDDRPMTKKQKEEYLREKQYRLKKEEMARLAALKSKEKQQPGGSQAHEVDSQTNSAPKLLSIPRIPKLNGARPAPETNPRMSGNKCELQAKRREARQTNSQEWSQSKQTLSEFKRPGDVVRLTESGRSNNVKFTSSVGEQEVGSSEARRYNSQTTHKGKDVYSERKPVQSVPSLREKRAAVEEKQFMREPSKLALNEERRSQNPQKRSAIRDERGHSNQLSRSDTRDERGPSNLSSNPVIKDEKRLSSQSGRPITKEERRPAQPENSKAPPKTIRMASSGGDARRDQIHQRVNDNLKTISNPARRNDDRTSKNVPPQSGNSMLKDRLTGPINNDNNLSQKNLPSSSQQVRKEIRSEPTVRNQNSYGSMPNRNQSSSNSAPNRNQNSCNSAPSRNQNSSGSAPNRNQNSSNSAPSSNQNSSGSAPNRNQNSSNSAPSRNQNSSGNAPNRNQNSSNSAPSSNQNSSGNAPNRSQNSSGCAPVRNQNSSNSAPVRNQGPSSGNGPVRQSLPKEKLNRNPANRPQAIGPQGPSRERPRGPPDRRREMADRGEMRRPPGMLDRGPPGGRFLPPGRPRPQETRRPPAKRRIESDDEYDSELDDFIDDGPEEGEDYSKYIKEIFGYDKARYSQVDYEDDDECMESNFAQQMKEEFVSTKLGIMEDLEDIKQEQMEKKRKKVSMMKKKRI